MLKLREILSRPKFKWMEWLATLWLVFFIFIPSLCAFCLSFMTKPHYAKARLPLTLEHYRALFSLQYLRILFSSFSLAVLSVLICFCISYPLIFFLRQKQLFSYGSMILIISCLPCTTNSIFRIYGLKQTLNWLYLFQKSLPTNRYPFLTINFLYSPFAVILGLVSLLFPFVFLPLWFAIDEIDRSQLEAARDLGASESQIFWHIIFPLTAHARSVGFVVAILPAIGMFYVSDVLGGARQILFGTILRSQLLVMKNPPLASATCCLLFLSFALGVGFWMGGQSIFKKFYSQRSNQRL